jgi:hypothetical protein
MKELRELIVNKVKVVDSVMGAGKTSYAIQMMNQKEGPWLYITPFLDEVKRIKETCKIRNFKEPKETQYSNKSEDLKRLIINNEM